MPIALQHSMDVNEDETQDSPPLTREQAEQLRLSQPSVSVWWVVGVQVALGLLASALAGWIWGRQVAASLAWGVWAVMLPTALFARGVTSRFARQNRAGAVVGFFVWELVKVVLTVLLLLLGMRVVTGLSWLAMLAGLILALKAYWVVMAMHKRPRAPAALRT